MSDNLPAVVKLTMKDFTIKKPYRPKDVSDRTLTAIDNSYTKCCFIDNSGFMLFDIERLDGVLRTTKSNVRYMISRLPDESKIYHEGKIYVRGYEIGKLIDIRIQETGTKATVEYLKYSEAIYKAVRDSESAYNIRAAAALELKEKRKKLKKKRIRKYKIKFDELTGEKLRFGSEFSHIRSFALFRKIAEDVENGLIVNKDTHSEITKRGVNDEVELLALCEEYNWSTCWYSNFKKYFSCE